MRTVFRRFFKDQSGATAIEYGLICSLVFLAIVGAIQLFASRSSDMYNNIAAKLQ